MGGGMRILKWVGIVLGIVLFVLFGTVSYLKSAAQARFATKRSVDVNAIPIPFPLSERELEDLRKQRAPAPAEAPVDQAAAQPEAAENQPDDVQECLHGAILPPATDKTRPLAKRWGTPLILP